MTVSKIKSDTVHLPKETGKVSLGGIFLSAGGGLFIPSGNFTESANPSFGILGRLEFTSTSIFPLIIGGEVSYFVFGSTDDFKVKNLINSFETKIFSAGINIEYSLSKILPSAFTIPFLTIDVKTNSVRRDYDTGINLTGYSRNQNIISVGAGFGFTLFIFDFYGKYNYISGSSGIGFYTKIKIPILKF